MIIILNVKNVENIIEDIIKKIKKNIIKISNVMLCDNITENEFKKMDLSNFYGQVKKDGEHLIIIKKGKEVYMYNRRGKEKSNVYIEIKEEVSKVLRFLDIDFMIVGEMCSFDDNFNNFQHRSNLQNPIEIEKRRKEIPCVAWLFDILEFQGKNLTHLPLIQRKIMLEYFRGLEHIQVLNYFETPQEIGGLWKWVKENNKEGIILKLKTSPYTFSRSKSWIKLKNWKEIEISFGRYEENPAGVKLINQEVEVQVQRDSSDRIERIKEKIDRGEKVKILVQYLEKTKAGKLRFPSCRSIL